MGCAIIICYILDFIVGLNVLLQVKYVAEKDELHQ